MLRGGAAGRRYAVRLGERGRIELPADVRHTLQVQPGDEVILTIEPAGIIRVTSRAEVARRCLGMLPPPPDRQLVAELVAERRAEAARR
jgi:AbrB family looped-hinge helix DNA binding protein